LVCSAGKRVKSGGPAGLFFSSLESEDLSQPESTSPAIRTMLPAFQGHICFMTGMKSFEGVKKETMPCKAKA
jgi:hypothetical protein